MIRIPYLEPLVNHFKASAILNGHGNPDLVDINGGNIFVMSDYFELSEIDNFFYGIIIHPMESEPLDIKDCATLLNHQVMIGAMVKNARSVRTNFQENVQLGGTSYTGAYPEAARFEEAIRQAVLEFNTTLEQGRSGYWPLELVRLSEPDEHNDLMIMPSIYQTKYTY